MIASIANASVFGDAVGAADSFLAAVGGSRRTCPDRFPRGRGKTRPRGKVAGATRWSSFVKLKPRRLASSNLSGLGRPASDSSPDLVCNNQIGQGSRNYGLFNGEGLDRSLLPGPPAILRTAAVCACEDPVTRKKLRWKEDQGWATRQRSKKRKKVHCSCPLTRSLCGNGQGFAQFGNCSRPPAPVLGQPSVEARRRKEQLTGRHRIGPSFPS